MIQELPMGQCAYGQALPGYNEASIYHMPECNPSASLELPISDCPSTGYSQPQPLPSPPLNTVIIPSETSRSVVTSPRQHGHHQTAEDFKKDVLRNSHTWLNEDIFTDWAYPPEGKVIQQKMNSEDEVQWGAEGGVDSLAPVMLNQNRIGPRHLTKFGLERIPEGVEKSGQGSDNAAFSSFDSSVSRFEADTIRSQTCTGISQVFRTSPTPRMLCPGPAATGRSTEQPPAGIGPKRRQQKLTMEQKRRNHIRYEKKRRTLIKDRLNDLTELIPELRGYRMSSSRILTKAAEMIKKTLQDNESLRAQVTVLWDQKVACNSNAKPGAEVG